MNVKIQLVCVSITCVGLLSACMSVEPFRLPASVSGGTSDEIQAILWVHNSSVIPFRTRRNYAAVTKVDGYPVDLHQSVELRPGSHRILVEHRRDSWVCGYFGCYEVVLGRHELALNAEEDHIYFPFAIRFCGQDWIWIEDMGKEASEELSAARKAGGYPQRWNPAESPYKVVAGVRPPQECPVSENAPESD